MTQARRSTLREIMTLAWRRFRYERGAYTFAASLRHAWAWVKGAADRAAQAARYAAAPHKTVLHLRHTAQSPIRRSLTGKVYAYSLARDAGRLTSRLGA
jgi:hypothetical protein